MAAILSICLGNLRRRKVQNSLIGLLLLLSTLLISTAINVITNSEDLYEGMHQETKGSHELLNLTKGVHDPQMVREWWAAQQGITVSSAMPYKPLAGIIHDGEDIPNLFLYMMNTPARPFGTDEPVFAQGRDTAYPEPGNIWVPTSLAYKYDVAVGDTLQFKAGKKPLQLTVSAVIIDLPLGGPFSTTARIWMNPADYAQDLGSLKAADSYLIGIRFDDCSQSPAYWERFEDYLGTPFMEERTTYEELSAFYFIMNKIIGFVMSFLGLVMMLVALYTIGFTISDAILANYKTIGIFKSLGLSSRQIISMYLIQYSFISLITIIPGLLLSRLLSGIIIEQSLSFLKTDHSSIKVGGTGIESVVGAAILLLILLVVWIYASKARSIQPMQAIRYGMSEADHSRTNNRWGESRKRGKEFARLPVPAVIGLRNITKNLKGSLLMLFLTTVTSAVLVFGLVLLNSIYQMQETSPLWGYDSSDVVVMVTNAVEFDRSGLIQDISADPRVLDLNWIGYTIGVAAADRSGNPEASGSRPQSVNIPLTVVEGSMDEIGLASTTGRNPHNRNEISIGINISRELHKEIGDIVELFIEGEKHSFTVTGIYQSIANMSYQARVTADVVHNLTPDAGYLNLQDSTDAGAIAGELNEKYGTDIQAIKQETLLNSVFKEATAVLIIPMSILGLLFLLITCFIIYSTSRIHIRKEIRTYGIYKSIGLTSNTIRSALTWGTAMLATLGAVLGIFCGVYLLPGILRGLLSSYGIIKLPLLMHWPGITLLALLSIAIAGGGCWAASRIIRSHSPRILVTE
ncbi:FtsX-like permease family protein [Paenibacillus sp. MMS20-IR301]|uniref:ABC transporter permease n=1 Tax=Paenibacillus sp. MMS20-IR301 TaxID=2895946 RepID=UPI0028E599D7|nr:FtsX-like permease family protein [Paenibacillus sp. MMS20-IR301]WNS46328.1 FtsX-like permease family protein [Paenibacillus sp. MMS20-IR301]